jgi:hypothetical protein
MANATLRYQDVWLLSDSLRGVAIVEVQDLRMNRIKTEILSPITSLN